MLQQPAFLLESLEASPLIAKSARTRACLLEADPSEISNEWVGSLYHSALARFGASDAPDWFDVPRTEISWVESDSIFAPMEPRFSRDAALDASFRLAPRVSRFEEPREGTGSWLDQSVQLVILGKARWDDALTYNPPVPDELRRRLPDVANGTWVSSPESFSFEWIGGDGYPTSPGRAAALRTFVNGDDAQEHLVDVRTEDRDGLQRLLDHLLAGGPGRYSNYAERLISNLEVLLGESQPVEGEPSVWNGMGVELAFRARVLLKLTEVVANQIAPSFVSDYARLLLQPPTPRNPQLGADLITGDGRIEKLEDAPSGIARWVLLIIGVAHEQAIDHWNAADAVEFQKVRRDDDPWDLASVWAVAHLLAKLRPPPPTQPVVVLADEPELHLHPEAAEEAATWIATLAQDRTVLVATHSPAFLNLPPSKAALVGLRRHEQTGLIQPFSIGTDALERLDALGDELGLGRNAFLHLTRGVVVVEGRADGAALNALAPNLISRNRLIVVVLHGSSNARRFAESEVIQKLGIPLALLLDNTSQDRLRQLEGGDDSDATQESRTQLRLKEIAQTTGLPLTLLNFDAPDIIAAVPDAVIHRQIDGSSQWSWDHCLTRWGNESSQGAIGSLNFKDWVLDQWGCSRKAGGAEVITSLFQETSATDEPPRVAVRLMKELEAWANSLGHSGPHQG
jgi:hypothetical protein